MCTKHSPSRGADPRGLKQALLAERFGTFDNTDVRNIDAALQQILRRFAIDPDKIGLTGFAYGASYALFLGRQNLDIFSRIAALSPTANWGGAEPQHPAPQLTTQQLSRFSSHAVLRA